MWYGSHDDLLEGNAETRFLTLEVDFSPVLQGSFPYLFVAFTSLRIPWEEPESAHEQALYEDLVRSVAEQR
jgi:hypothetical protein